MVIDSCKDLLYQLMPHGGAMRLIDAIVSFDESNIHCETLSHQDKANPLRSDKRLDIIHSIEYAAQAAGLHLTQQAKKKHQTKHKGFLASIQSFEFQADILDNVRTPLAIKCHQIFLDDRGCLYEFVLSSNKQTLSSGRFLIVFSGEAA